MLETDFITRLKAALDARQSYFDPEHKHAFRLLNGFTEGTPDISADIYARTLVLHNYSKQPDSSSHLMNAAEQVLVKELPWIQSAVFKVRYSDLPEKRNGVVHGRPPDTAIIENGVHYAVDLCLNLDTSFYLDTRNLRTWVKDSLASKFVLNTFAYTASFGVAARIGGASAVINLDMNASFLNIGKSSLQLNGLQESKQEFLRMDFWSAVKQFKHLGTRFDCVILDPPFFTKTRKASLDLNKDTPRLINKVRPLINHNGYLVVINNALFLTGSALYASIEELCRDGFLSIDQIIPVPKDMTGFPQTISGSPPADPTPFNHPTKIIILRVFQK